MPFVLASIASIGMLMGYKLDESFVKDRSTAAQNNPTDYHPGKIEELLKFIDARYVDEVDTDALSEEAIQFLLNRLDPYSTYLSPQQVAAYRDQINGQYKGMGFQLNFFQDTLFVTYIYPDSPAKMAGIEPGDQILKINQHETIGPGLDINQIQQYLDEADQIRLTYRRMPDGRMINKTVQKAIIDLGSVTSYYAVDDSIGYIALSHFTTNSYRDFMLALESLVEEKGLKHLIFDLRSNPGGVLDEAIKILQQFYTTPRKLLLYTQGDHAARMEYKTSGRTFFDIKNIVILINGSSASASEIVAGAIQDTDRGIVIGQNSYGKGLVQEQYKLRNGGEVRMTIARYYTPSGRLIQKPYNHTDGQKDRIQSDSLIFKTESGRPVKAAGGITPDIIIADDHTKPLILDTLLDQKALGASIRVYNQLKKMYERKNIKQYLSDHQKIKAMLLQEFIHAAPTKYHQFISTHSEPIANQLFKKLMYMMGGDFEAKKIENMEDPFVERAIKYLQSQNKKM